MDSPNKHTPEEIDLIKRTVAKGATADELKSFLYHAEKLGLDPLLEQIRLIKRKVKNKDGTYRDVRSVQTGIDTYRLIADRTKQYAGNDDAVFVYKDGSDPFAAANYPLMATVVVYKMVEGQRCAFTASARWDQYYPGDRQGFMWKKMPELMLGKCAESLALRKAFPAELAGTYTTEEMQQADSPPPETPQKPATATRPAAAKASAPAKGDGKPAQKKEAPGPKEPAESNLTKPFETACEAQINGLRTCETLAALDIFFKNTATARDRWAETKRQDLRAKVEKVYQERLEMLEGDKGEPEAAAAQAESDDLPF